MLKFTKLLLSACLATVLWANAALAYSGTILFAGGEDVDFLSCSGTCTTVTTAGKFRAGWSKMAYAANPTNADPPTNSFITPTFANQTTIWVHGQFIGPSSGTTASAQLLCVFASDGNPAVCIRGTGTTGQVKIDTRNTSGTFVTLVTCASSTFPTVNLDQIDFQLTYAVAGSATLYQNGVSICTFTGDTTTNSRTAVNQVRFAGASNSAANQWSEVVIGTTDTTKLNYLDTYMVANGNSVAWTGTNICSAIWAANAESDASFANAASNSLLHNCTIYHTIPAGTYNPLAVVMSARALVGATGPQHFSFDTRIGGTDYQSSNFAPTGSFANFPNYIQTTNPNSTLPWTTGDLTGTLNFGLESQP